MVVFQSSELNLPPSGRLAISGGLLSKPGKKLRPKGRRLRTCSPPNSLTEMHKSKLAKNTDMKGYNHLVSPQPTSSALKNESISALCAAGRRRWINVMKSIECPICLEPMTHPITVHCGHSFCFSCLFLSTISRCPLCRAGPLVISGHEIEECDPEEWSGKSHSSDTCDFTRVDRRVAARCRLLQLGSSFLEKNSVAPLRSVDDPKVILNTYHAIYNSAAPANAKGNLGSYPQDLQLRVREYLCSCFVKGFGPPCVDSFLRFIAKREVNEERPAEVYYEGGYARRRAPSLAVLRPLSTWGSTDDPHRSHVSYENYPESLSHGGAGREGRVQRPPSAFYDMEDQLLINDSRIRMKRRLVPLQLQAHRIM